MESSYQHLPYKERQQITQKVIKLAYKKDKSLYEIGNLFGLTRRQVCGILQRNKHNPLLKELTEKFIGTEGENMTLKERKELTSYYSTDMIISRRNSFGRSKKYSPYRSKGEYLYAEHLKDCGIEFEYERMSFEFTDKNNQIRNYIPDFYLPDRDVYIEIKPYKTDRGNGQRRLFNEKIYQTQKEHNIRIEILDKKALEDMGLY